MKQQHRQPLLIDCGVHLERSVCVLLNCSHSRRLSLFLWHCCDLCLHFFPIIITTSVTFHWSSSEMPEKKDRCPQDFFLEIESAVSLANVNLMLLLLRLYYGSVQSTFYNLQSFSVYSRAATHQLYKNLSFPSLTPPKTLDSIVSPTGDSILRQIYFNRWTNLRCGHRFRGDRGWCLHMLIQNQSVIMHVNMARGIWHRTDEVTLSGHIQINDLCQLLLYSCLKM